MIIRTSARLHAWLLTALAVIGARLRAAPQSGQGTVEYVALILLVAGVLAGAVTAATGGKGFDLGSQVTTALTKAIGKVNK